jgi:hypothetical protein
MRLAGWILVAAAWVMLWMPIEAGASLSAVALCGPPALELANTDDERSNERQLCSRLAERRAYGAIAVAALGVVFLFVDRHPSGRIHTG